MRRRIRKRMNGCRIRAIKQKNILEQKVRKSMSNSFHSISCKSVNWYILLSHTFERGLSFNSGPFAVILKLRRVSLVSGWFDPFSSKVVGIIKVFVQVLALDVWSGIFNLSRLGWSGLIFSGKWRLLLSQSQAKESDQEKASGEGTESHSGSHDKGCWLEMT